MPRAAVTEAATFLQYVRCIYAVTPRHKIGVFVEGRTSRQKKGIRDFFWNKAKPIAMQCIVSGTALPHPSCEQPRHKTAHRHAHGHFGPFAPIPAKKQCPATIFATLPRFAISAQF
jgi:hypothetical protein